MPTDRPSVFWRWFFWTAFVLACLLSAVIWQAMQPGRPLDVVPPAAK